MKTSLSREFTIQSKPWNQHQLTFVAMESDEYARNTAICPEYRVRRVSAAMECADLTVLEYFPPELEEKVYSAPLIGSVVKALIAPSDHYSRVTAMASTRGLRVGVADIANRPMYAAYGVPPLSIEWFSGVNCVRPTKHERYCLTPTDARRMKPLCRKPIGIRKAHI